MKSKKAGQFARLFCGYCGDIKGCATGVRPYNNRMKNDSRKQPSRACVLSLCFVAGLSFPAVAADKKWHPHVDFEGKLGSERSLGEADVFFPLAQDDDTLLFGNLRARLDNDSSSEANIGLGLRHMLRTGWNVGGYAYFDRRRSEADNYFSQITIGAEALSEDWDLRTNGYIAVGDREHAAAGFAGASITGTTIVLRSGLEKSMQGFDAELGWRVPVFTRDDAQQLRFYAGGYHFNGDDVADISGPRLRAELVFDEIPALWQGSRFSLGAEWQHDDPRGSQGFVTARLRVPLQAEGSSGTALAAQTAMERRMTAPVVRDIDIVTQAGAFGASETVTETAGGQTITVLSSDVTAGGDLAAAVAGAGPNSTVILTGDFDTGANATVLQTGQTLMGAGTITVRAPSGQTASLTTGTASITGVPALAEGTVMMADDSTLMGMTIIDTDVTANNAIAVRVNGRSNVRIINNDITAIQNSGFSGTAHGVNIANSTNVEVSGNTITVENNATVNVSFAVNINNSSALVKNNILDATEIGGGLADHTRLNNVNILAGSTGNTVVNGECSVFIAGTGGVVSYTNAADCGP